MLFLRKKVLLSACSPSGFRPGLFGGSGDRRRLTGPTFTLTAGTGYVSTGDGSSVYFGVTAAAGPDPRPDPDRHGRRGRYGYLPDLPAPHNTSIIFPGQQVATAAVPPGLLTNEAAPGGSVTYSFTPTKPGTYTYHSGTNADLQVKWACSAR